MDELAKMMGFKDEQELHRMVASVDLTTPQRRQAFDIWKEFDGSRGGLSKLLSPATEDNGCPACAAGMKPDIRYFTTVAVR